MDRLLRLKTDVHIFSAFRRVIVLDESLPQLSHQFLIDFQPMFLCVRLYANPVHEKPGMYVVRAVVSDPHFFVRDGADCRR